jgi:hypothetical protein
MASPKANAPVPALTPAIPGGAPSPKTSNAADYIYRIGAMIAGVILLITVM